MQMQHASDPFSSTVRLHAAIINDNTQTLAQLVAAAHRGVPGFLHT